MDFLKLKVRIPTGNSKFANLVKYDGIYVDKTKFIYEVTTNYYVSNFVKKLPDLQSARSELCA